MNIVPRQDEHEATANEGPSLAELAEVEREWPLIAAELDLLDAEIAVLSAEGRVTALDRRRVRRAERRVLEVGRELAAEDGAASAGGAVA
jgi:hypothetical protein